MGSPTATPAITSISPSESSSLALLGRLIYRGLFKWPPFGRLSRNMMIHITIILLQKHLKGDPYPPPMSLIQSSKSFGIEDGKILLVGDKAPAHRLEVGRFQLAINHFTANALQELCEMDQGKL